MSFFTSDLCSITTLIRSSVLPIEHEFLSIYVERNFFTSVKIYYESTDRDGLVSSILIPNYGLNNFFS